MSVWLCFCEQMQDFHRVTLQRYRGNKSLCAECVSPCISAHLFVSVVWMWACRVGSYWCWWGGGSPSWAVIISGVGCQRAIMTAWLCGCWRGAITLKSLVWQAFGVCARVCIVCAGVRVWLWKHCLIIYPSVHTWVYFSVCQPEEGERGRAAASVNVRNRNKPPNTFVHGDSVENRKSRG